MRRFITITMFIIAGLTTRCSDDFMASPENSERNLSLVDASTDGAGNTSGQLAAGSTTTQVLSASAGDAAGTSVSFPPGALAISTKVSISGGESLVSSSSLTDIGLSTLTSGGTSVAILSSTKTELTTPALFSIPTSSTGLMAVSNDLWVVLYRTINQDGTYNFGLIPNQDLVVESGKIKFASKNFGVFQAAIAPTKITEAKKVPCYTPPVPKSSATNPFVGQWVSACKQDNHNDPNSTTQYYRADTMQFTETTFVYVEVTYLNATCTGDYYERGTVAGSYTTGDTYGEGSKFNVVFTSRSKAYGTDAGVTDANTQARCGITDWAKAVARSVTNNCDPDPAHNGPRVGDTWYSIYKIEEQSGAKYFRMGNDQNGTLGTTEDTRATTLESSEKAMKRIN